MIYLHTKDTSYVMNIKEYGKIEQVYYGKKIREDENLNLEKQTSEFAHSVLYKSKVSLDTLEKVSLELGESGKGDFREPMINLRTKDGYTTDFCYISHKLLDKRCEIDGLPFAKDATQTVEITLFDEMLNLELKLYYNSFFEANIITRHAKLINKSEEKIEIIRLMSFNLDIDNDGYELINFEGDWANEMQEKRQKLTSGIYINDSKVGTSSNRHNPFFMLKQLDASEYHGDCYGFNLIYSGNHAEIVEITPSSKIRILSGINPHNFNFSLGKNEEFFTPEAVLTYSDKGLNGLSQNMHCFVSNHIIPENFRNKERPILINNWEATYFDFDKNKLLDLASAAKDVGIELFVLDDGWFGDRNSDKTSLGDWTPNEKKLGGTLSELAGEINALGLDFGLWFEPEMISENSELFKNNPEYRLGKGNVSTGRNQFILDLTKDEVCDYIVNSVVKILESANISYVKWDMNRNFSDVFSDRHENQGEICHRYVLGLYKIYDILTKKFPNILFEGCSAGGNRFDLGILSYMPQIWASDDTDAHKRVAIQKSISYGYPQNTYGSHVSACPNHQTLRKTPIETRFNISSIGALGYELDLLNLSENEKEIVKKQISYYKENRKILQFGNLYRLTTNEDKTMFLVLNEDKSEGFVGEFYNLQQPNPNFNKISTKYLDENMYYEINSREQFITIKGEVYKLASEKYQGYGDAINHKGVKLNMQKLDFPQENTRLICDFGSRLYKITKA